MAKARKLKVYGWQSFRRECTGPHRQTREIVAATSMAEVARIAGVNGPWSLFSLCETGNEREIGIAMVEPGVIFWRPINDWNGDYVKAGAGTS
jgi:hypothetical protein